MQIVEGTFSKVAGSAFSKVAGSGVEIVSDKAGGTPEEQTGGC